MSDDIHVVAVKWHKAAADLISDAIRDWNREADHPSVAVSDSIADMSIALVRWCDESGKPIDPTPITDFLRFAREAESLARVDNSAGVRRAFNSCSEAISRCGPVVDRIYHCGLKDWTAKAQLKKQAALSDNKTDTPKEKTSKSSYGGRKKTAAVAKAEKLIAKKVDRTTISTQTGLSVNHISTLKSQLPRKQRDKKPNKT